MADKGPPTTADTASSRTPVIVLGASNVTLGGSIVFDTIRRVLSSPVDVFAAIGLGRSYGSAVNVLGRWLPGILHCGLWDAVQRLSEREPADRWHALITDVGNDLAYGYEVEQVLTWVEECLQRIMNLNANVVITTLPVQALAEMSPMRFTIMQHLIYPFRHLSYQQTLHNARELDSELRQLGNRYDATLVQTNPAWYSMDGIHFPFHRMPAVWASILSQWCDDAVQGSSRSVEVVSHDLRNRFRVQTARPQRFKYLGIPFQTPQPCRCWPDGSTLALY